MSEPMQNPASAGYTPEERRWLAENPLDPRADCPNRDQHAHRMYGKRWSEPFGLTFGYPKLDGRSVAKTYRQMICEGCSRYMIWLPKADGKSASSGAGESRG